MHDWRPFTLALCAACASPPEATTDLREAEAALLARAPEVDVVRAGLALADLDALALSAPTEAELADPASDGFWHGSAYAFAPAVRAARAEARALAAAEPAAGAPGPVGANLVDHEFGGAHTLAEAGATLDLIGLLGLGPSAAERGVARAATLAAVSRLERALWEARFAVDRARVRLAAARARERRLGDLLGSARADLPRVEILERRGRVGAAQAEAARGKLHALEVARSRADDALATARADLARASGLPPAHPALGVPGLDDLRRLASAPVEPAAELAAHHPRLRSARLAVALEEARLRAAAASAWPGLRLGPSLQFPFGDASEVRLGGMLQLQWPFPARWRGRLAAAAEARDRGVERFQEDLLDLLAQERAAQARLEGARARLATHAPPVVEAAAGSWRAVRARFRVQRADVLAWIDALERHLEANNLEVDAAEAAALARLDLAEARGPAPQEVPR